MFVDHAVCDSRIMGKTDAKSSLTAARAISCSQQVSETQCLGRYLRESTCVLHLMQWSGSTTDMRHCNGGGMVCRQVDVVAYDRTAVLNSCCICWTPTNINRPSLRKICTDAALRGPHRTYCCAPCSSYQTGRPWWRRHGKVWDFLQEPHVSDQCHRRRHILFGSR